MAESTKLTKESVLAHLQDQEDKALKFSGKAGYNPHIFIEMKLKPARFLVQNEGDKEENLKKAMEVKFDEKSSVVRAENIVPEKPKA